MIFKMKTISRLLSFVFIFILSAQAQALIHIIAAENFYGEIAKELGGQYVEVNSILTNPSQDPHLFTASSSTVKALSQADIVIYNGAGYDPWITSLLKMENKQSQQKIEVASLLDLKPSANPHIWYSPNTVPLLSRVLTEMLIKDDPIHAKFFQAQFDRFNQTYQQIWNMIARLKIRLQNTAVIATEPVFNYMADSLELKMHGVDFQINMMNDIPPSVTQIKTFEDDLKQHQVKLLIYNKQVINPMTEHMRQLAQEQKIPVIGISETLPQGLTYIEWMIQELKELENALISR